MGVRSSLTLVHKSGQLGLTLTMYATRPRVLDASRAPVAELLIAFGSAVMRNTSTFDAASGPPASSARAPIPGRWSTRPRES